MKDDITEEIELATKNVESGSRMFEEGISGMEDELKGIATDLRQVLYANGDPHALVIRMKVFAQDWQHLAEMLDRMSSVFGKNVTVK